jgi:hypothetical protein
MTTRQLIKVNKKLEEMKGGVCNIQYHHASSEVTGAMHTFNHSSSQ